MPKNPVTGQEMTSEKYQQLQDFLERERQRAKAKKKDSLQELQFKPDTGTYWDPILNRELTPEEYQARRSRVNRGYSY